MTRVTAFPAPLVGSYQRRRSMDRESRTTLHPVSLNFSLLAEPGSNNHGPQPYVNSYRDIRNGKMRHVFRRRGYKKLLKGRPGSAELMDHYAALLASSEDVAAPIGASKIKPGSIDALVVRYLQHDFFTKGLAKATRDARRPILDNFRQCRTPSGFRYGENRIATIQRKNISDALAGKTPVMQKVWLKAIRHLIAFAIDQGDCKTDPTIGIKTTRPPKTSGHVTWGDAQIEQYRERHTIGTMARLALELMLNIAARRHDAHLIGRQHLKMVACRGVQARLARAPARC